MDATSSSSDSRALLLQPHPDRINIDPCEELEKIFQEAKTGDNGEYLFLQNLALLLLRLEPRAAVQVFSNYTPLTHFVRAKADFTVIQEVAQMFKANISEYEGVSRADPQPGESHNAFHEVACNGGSEELAHYIFREFPEMLLVEKNSITSNVGCLLESNAHPLPEKVRLLDLMFELQPCLLKDPKRNAELFAAALENRYGSRLKAVLFSKLAETKPTFFTLDGSRGVNSTQMAPEDISCLVQILRHLKSFECTRVNWGKEGYTYLINSLHLMGSEIQSLKIPYLVGATQSDECTGQALFDRFMENSSSLQSLTLLIRDDDLDDDDLDEINDDSLLEKAYKDICRAVQNHPTIDILELSANKDDQHITRLRQPPGGREVFTPMSGAAFLGFFMSTSLEEITFEYFKLSSMGWPEHNRQLSASQCTKIKIELCHFTSAALEQLLVYLQNNAPPNLRELFIRCVSTESSDPKIDATAPLCSLLNDGCLENFDFGAPGLCNIDMYVLLESLVTNTSLTRFHLMVDDLECASAEVAMRNLLGKNKTLENAGIIDYNLSLGECPLDFEEDIMQLLELNRSGRAMVHARETTKAELVDLLGSIDEAVFNKHAIQFGLLLERPSLWS